MANPEFKDEYWYKLKGIIGGNTDVNINDSEELSQKIHEVVADYFGEA
jgi:hypothetical protein